LEAVRAFMRGGQPLPPRPVLLTFDDAGRETVDAVDPILAETGMTAVAFVSVAEVARGSIALASRRRLESMTLSGHWDVAVRACQAGDAAAAQLAAQAATLAGWAGAPVNVVGCPRGFSGADASAARWP